MPSFHFSPLKPGDLIAITAPAYGIPIDIMEKIIDFIKSWELIPHVEPFWEKGRHLLFAADDEQRLESLKAAFCSAHAKAIWVPGGGAGTTRLIPNLLSWVHTLSSPPPYKLFIGLSDVTALHTLIMQEWGWPTLHAPTLQGIVKNVFNEESVYQLKEFIFGNVASFEEKNLIPLNAAALQEGMIKASLAGGNHSVLQYSLATAWQIDCRYKILFLEDVDEAPYRIDLRLDQLIQSQALQWAKAILLGDFNYISEPTKEDPNKLEYVLKSFAQRLSVPVFRMMGYGHAALSKPLLMGVPVELQTGNNPSLKINVLQS